MELKKEKGELDLRAPPPPPPTPSLLPTSRSGTSEPAQVPAGCSTESGPAPAAHLEVAGREVKAATLGLGDALEPAEDEALVALAALHAAVLASHARERGMAGVRAQLGTQGVSAVGWAGQRWWRGGTGEAGLGEKERGSSQPGARKAHGQRLQPDLQKRGTGRNHQGAQPPPPGPGGDLAGRCQEAGPREQTHQEPQQLCCVGRPQGSNQNPCGPTEALKQDPRELGQDWELWGALPPSSLHFTCILLHLVCIHTHVHCSHTHTLRSLGRLSFSLFLFKKSFPKEL